MPRHTIVGLFHEGTALAEAHVFVVIPVHNRLALTRTCLAALDEQTTRNTTVVVVDDGSDDGTHEALSAEFPTVVVLKGDGSLWWTGAMNLGVGWVLGRAVPSDLVLTLNNDTIPPTDYVEGLLRAHELTPDTLIGSLLVQADDKRTIIDGGVHINWVTAKFHTAWRGIPLTIDERGGPQLHPVDVLSGCGTLVPVRAYRRVGPYDQDRLRHYAADFEFSRRAGRAGFDLAVDWNSPLYVHQAETGIHASVEDHGPLGLLRSFWSIRSANDIRTRLAFAMAACPRWALPLYVPMDLIRVTTGSLRRYRSGQRNAGTTG